MGLSITFNKKDREDTSGQGGYDTVMRVVNHIIQMG